MVKHVLTYCLLFIASFTLAQSAYVKIKTSALKVEENEPFRVAIESNASRDFDYDFPDEFIDAGGTSTSQQSYVDMNTRQAVLLYMETSTFVIKEKGKYKIGPVKIQTKNGEISSNTIIIEVVEPVNLTSENPADNMDQNFFGIIQQSAKELYEGQPLILSAKLYAQQELFTLLDYQSFVFEGPAEEHFLQAPGSFQRADEVVNNKKVEVISGGKVLLFPEQSGHYDLEPFRIAFNYRLNNSNRPQRSIITSNRSEVLIKPLPNGAPKNFIGAVGQYKVSCTSEGKSFKVGDVFEYKVRISGAGNLHNIETPQLQLPKGLTLYGDPEIHDSIFFNTRGAEGSKTFVYNVQILQGKSFKLDGVTISYFDPEVEKYIEVSGEQVKLKAKGESIALPDTKEKKQEKAEEPLRTILVDVRSDEKENDFYNSGLFWTGVGAPISLAFVFGFLVKYRNENEESIALNQKKKQAKKLAVDELGKAKAALAANKQEEFYIEIAHALKLFIANKHNIDTAQVTRAYIDELNINATQKQGIKSIFDQCDEAKYSLYIDRENQEMLLNATAQIVNELNEVL
ncbi:Oxygen tolerance [Lishizhenia tianjinensis]|uniref:Oxygen tolerance n=1 Tax=Lishizhenia tianjinensis TaxID=477690 RepID=A0A1I7A2E7_9FLAO|nr:BatD family protein [Lishizhenia tianjinensis]SFT69082.1 Oxygen tolerance [Lishizhenia tianjinensis]